MARFTLFLLVFALLSPGAYAQTLGGACSTAGETSSVPGTGGMMNMLYCNGSTWVASSIVVGNTATTCNSSVAGALRWSGGSMQYCDGTSWYAFSSTSSGGSTGYFVMTYNKYSGDMTGFASANTKCRTDLAAYNWKNKPGTIDTNKIFAYLCDSTSCNNLLPNTTYTFAHSGNTSYGGATFITDAMGRVGIGASGDWAPSDRTRFRPTSDYMSYWSGREHYNETLLSTLPKTSVATNNCYNWTNTYGNGFALGFTLSNGGSDTFTAGSDMSCNYLLPLICFLNP